MTKPVLGLVVGGALGVLDGLSALVSAPNDPAVKAAIAGIVAGATVKGALGGAITGWFARTHRTGINIAFGLAVGLAFALLVCLLQKMGGQNPYYLQIMVPGGLVGSIAGYVTSVYGRAGVTSAAPTKAGPAL